jgi:tetratricopeptide (TPR) repeat protein
LDALPLEEATDLLRTLMGPRSERQAPDSGELTELAERCARLPLALRIAAEAASADPVRGPGELLAGLRDGQRQLDLLDAAGDPRTAVRSVFFWSYQHLSPLAARAFAVIGLHPSREFDVFALAALTGRDLAGSHAVMAELIRAHLVEPAPGNAFAMHDLLRAYAAEQALDSLTPEEQHAALSRLFDHYLASAAAAMATLFPHDRRNRPEPVPTLTPLPPVEDNAAQWLDQRRATLVAAGVYAGRHGWPRHCVDLSRVLWRAFEVGGHYQDALILHGAAVHAAQECGHGHAAALTNLGSVQWWLGDHHAAQANFEQALAEHARAADLGSEARTLARLGLVHERLGDYHAAAEHLKRALERYRATGDRHGEGSQLINLGALHRRLGESESAASELCQAAEIFVELGDVRLEGYALGNLAAVRSESGRHAEALAHLERSLELCRRSGDRGGEGSALSTIGAVHGRAGRFASALEYLRRGLAVSRETGDRSLETETLNALGETLLAAGRPASATVRHRSALELAEHNGDRFEQARALYGLAAAAEARGYPEDGREHRERARGLRQSLGINAG